jgi:hypothetical protein
MKRLKKLETYFINVSYFTFVSGLGGSIFSKNSKSLYSYTVRYI